MTRRRALLSALTAGSLALAFALGSGCGNSTTSVFPTGPDGGGNDALGDDSPSCGLGCGDSAFNGPYNDFPSPIIDAPDAGPAAPGNSQTLFGGPSQGAQSGGPCLIEPEVGSLYPHNWLRPRFHWIAATGENLFELRVHADNQVNDLLVYTTQTSWTMPKAMWQSLSGHSADVPMTVGVRGAVLTGGMLSGEALGSSGPLGIAPVDAPGSIVYWTTTTQSLNGFTVGDESVTPVLLPAQVQEYPTTCIGCHTSTPDGKFAGLTTSTNSWSNALADIEQNLTGQVPSFLGAGGKAVIEQNQMGISTFSLAHWATGDHVEVVHHDPNNDGNAELYWVDLEATAAASASGVIARTGDALHAGAPAWSHDGNTIAYVSTDALRDGRLDNGPADIYTVPYNSRAGGTATPLAGASDPAEEEYYPVFSPDDKWIAFDKIPVGNTMYNQPLAEVNVISSAGGTAVRLEANDPPQCTTLMSPGVTNSWPKWAPSPGTAGTRTFYWLVFSSTRSEARNPQLYVTPVVVDGTTVTTYHALYLWNQPADQNNHTPAWDVFKLPPPPVK
jgi:hypothetical protein